jgi:hypothetical protein
LLLAAALAFAGCNGPRIGGPAGPPAPAEPDAETHQQYAVKFVCGEQQTPPQILSRGRYFTAVNIHNPRLDRPVDFLFKVAVAEPGLQVGSISGFTSVPVPPDGALEIDCPTIMEFAGGGAFRKGFVVIISRDELDVVAVYTAGREPAAVDEVTALHMERVPPRPVVDVLEHIGPNPDEMSCSGAGCCCNTPMSQSNPGAGQWPACDAGFECRALEPGGVLHPTAGRVDVNVCVAQGASPLTVPFISSTQPSFCRTDLR